MYMSLSAVRMILGHKDHPENTSHLAVTTADVYDDNAIQYGFDLTSFMKHVILALHT
jgi:hypothetical protein